MTIQHHVDDSPPFLPRFANLKLLGQGGEGAVFAAWDRIRKMDLALKLMRDASGEGLAERFEREYTILATSRSNNLVTVYDHGVEHAPLADGTEVTHYWYTMERCESSVRSNYRRMPLSRRVGVALQMLDGLAFLHAQNIAHRDIKPDNIFLVKGQVKIGDFGLARTHQVPGGVTGNVGLFMGSPPYLAPERWTGYQNSDWRPSDQYAAGVTIYELLSRGGAPLEYGSTQDSCFQAHWYGGVYPLRIPELGGRELPSLDWVIGRMLAKRPEERYADVAECKREFAAALAQDDVEGA